MTTEEILEAISTERKRQLEKWGDQEHEQGTWLLILMEEIGEVSQDILQSKDEEYVFKELIQSAAVIVAWLEDVTR
ncbi:MAG: hypothetical protein RLP44_02355 [Aggregatilineales bacterium]